MHTYRFRWIFCQLEVLRQCLPSSVRGVLAALPESLDETYERILQQIPKPNQVHAHRLLHCITVAVRPLRVEELAEVLAIDFSATGGAPKVNETLRWEDQEQAVLSTCSSLIAIVEDRGYRFVQFSHFSVKEFLTSDRLSASTMDGLRYHHIRLETAHTIMAQACLGVLLRLDKSMDKQTIRSFPLADYAGNYFGYHVEFENVLSHVTGGVEDLLDPDKPSFYTWIWLQIDDWYCNRLRESTGSLVFFEDSRPFPQYPPRISPLYYVAALGYLCLARHIVLKRPQDLRTKDDKGCTPLHKAALLGRDEVSQLLIGHSIDLGIRDIEDRTLLHMATYKGLSTVVRMLLEHDGPFKVPVNARTKEGQTALHLALRHHHLSIVELLLEFGADVDVEESDNTTPLLLALRLSYYILETAQLLLEHGASVHVRDEYGRTPLHLASRSNLPSIVALLLKFGANVGAQDHDKITPLLLASRSRSVATIKVLLEHGANVHVRDETGQTPLHFASKHNLSSVVALLLKFGADVDAKEEDGLTPLLFALQFARTGATAQLLLQHRARIHARNEKGQAPLHLASQGGLSDIVASLLKLGAHVDARDNDDMTPLHFASQSQYSQSGEIVRLLQEHGADIQARNKNGQTPLHLASEGCHSSTVSLLLNFGADMDAEDNNRMTPRHPLSYPSQDISISIDDPASGDDEDDERSSVDRKLLGVTRRLSQPTGC